MLKRFHFSIALLIVPSMILGACASPAAAPVVEATEAPAAVVTEAPAPAATEAVIEEVPQLDMSAVASAVFDRINSENKFLSIAAPALNEQLADKPPFLLDVREPAEVEEGGFIEGSVNIPIRDLLKNLDKLPGLDDPIVVYCGVGHRGGMVLAALTSLGYTNVRSLSGGLGAWNKAELPLVTGSLPAAPESISQPVVADQALFTAWDAYLSGLPQGFYSVKTDKLAEELAGSEAPFLLDVRTVAEFDKDGYIEGAVNIPMGELLANLDQLPALDQPIVVYCGIGHRGAIVLSVLNLLGYENVRSLTGGLNAWKTAQLPLVGWVDWMSVWSEFLSGLPAGFYSIKADVLNTALVEEAPFLLDVREPAEVEENGFIAGAVNIPTREVLKNLDKLPVQDQPIVVYCASGHRGGMVMAALRALGYSNVTNLNGGMGAWKKADFLVETGEPAAPAAGTAPEVDAARLRDLETYFSALPDNFHVVKAADLNTELAGGESPVIIDLRTDEEYAGGYIEGAVHINVTDLFASLDQLPADKAAPIVLTCASGHRGGIGLVALNMIGYTNVRNLGGGMGAWAAAELPVVK